MRAEPPPLSAQEYRRLVETSPVMIRRTRADAECDFCNATWLAFTGRPFENERGHGWTGGVHPEDLEGCLQVYRGHFERRQPFQMEYRLRRHDGAYRYISDRGAPFREGGEFRGFILFGVDVHERRQTERSRESFLRMMAHELRTPLQAVKIYVEIIRRDAEQGRPYRPEPYEKLAAQSSRLERLIGNLSEAGRLESLSIEREPLDLVELLRRLVETRSDELRTAPERWPHELQFEHDGGAARLRGDRQRLEQAFANLLDNAVKYSPRGGPIGVALESNDGSHRVLVSDEGIGIPTDEIPLVTRPFFRGSNVSTNNYPGVGLGLAMASEIVRRHRGTLAIQSELGRGTTVSVRLPPSEDRRA